MGCCNKHKESKLKQSFSSMGDLSIQHELPKNAIFSGFWGKLFYFIILMIVALTPIVNLAALYVFYLAVYGKNVNKKVKNAKEFKDSNEAE